MGVSEGVVYGNREGGDDNGAVCVGGREGG